MRSVSSARHRATSRARPRLPRGWFLLLAFGLLLLPPAASARAAQRPAFLDGPEYRVVLGINEARARYGLRPLRPDPSLTHVAYLHSRDMARRSYYAHDTLHGRPWNLRIKHYVHASIVGETLDLLYGPRGRQSDATRVVMDWLHSPPHRAVLLTASLGRIGVARAAKRYGRPAFFTADFAN
jgi:uncharacterized protein YkwD